MQYCEPFLFTSIGLVDTVTVLYHSLQSLALNWIISVKVQHDCDKQSAIA